MAVETNARIEFSVASVEEWEKVNPKLHQGEPVFAKKSSGKYILKVGAPGGSTYKNAVVVWDQDDAETKMTSTQEAAAQALASKNASSASASAAKASENAAAASKSAAATSAANAKTSETNAASSKTAAANSASTASAKATESANSSSAAATSEKNAAKSATAAAASEEHALSSANAASTSASNAQISETNAANSASAAAKSAADAAKFDPSSYYSKAEVDAKIPTKTSQLTNNSGYMTNADISLKISAAKAEVRADIPTKVSQLTNDSGYITKADITEGSTPDLTPYMKKHADSDLMMGVHKLIFGNTEISDDFRNTIPMFTIDATGGRGVNIKGPGVLVNGIPIATETDLSDKLDKTGTADKATRDGAGNVITETYATKADVSGVVKSVNGTKPDSNGNVSITVSGGSNVTVDTTLSATSTNPIANKTVYSALGGKLGKTETAYAATKATQDGAGNVIATTYIKTVNNLKPDSNGNVNISGGTGGNITVDSVLSPTSTNAIQNRVVQQEFTSVRATIPTKVSQLTNDSGYLTQHQSLDGYVKTVNNTAPDSNGNVTIALSGGGGVSTSESNTWTGKQTFQKMKFNFESYNAPRISGATDNPSESVAVYNVQGNFTLDMSELAGLLSNGDATVFTAYITANGSYTLSITNAGTLKYAGSAADLAITANGLLLNIFLTKSSSGVVTSIVQATKLS